MNDPRCMCGHVQGQHELRTGGRLGCYIVGCLCIDFEPEPRPRSGGRRVTHLAIDLALAGPTGVAWGPGRLDHDSFTCPSKLRGGERLRWIRRRIAEHIDGKEPRITALVVEAPFMSRTHPTGAIPLIKLHGAVEHAAAVKGLSHYEVPAATLKAHATGKGNATKAMMIAAANDLGLDVGDDHNRADAALLWRFWAQRERGAA